MENSGVWTWQCPPGRWSWHFGRGVQADRIQNLYSSQHSQHIQEIPKHTTMQTFGAFGDPSSLRRFFFLPSISRGLAEMSENLLMRAGGHENGFWLGIVGRAGRCVWLRTCGYCKYYWFYHNCIKLILAGHRGKSQSCLVANLWIWQLLC